jgi:tRNA threonylcarbamoyladenosine biosynthesis protein TsaB
VTILAFDTSGSVLSLSLLVTAGGDAASVPDPPPASAAGPGALHVVRKTGLQHAEHLVATARDLLAAAGFSIEDVDLVACADGPGSFTGLRIGMSTAKGFAAARAIPFVAVPTLDIWAELYRYWPGVVLPVLDARKRRFYAALYAGGEKLTGDLDEAPESILELAREAAARNSSASEAAAPSAGSVPPSTSPEAELRGILIAGPSSESFAAAVRTAGLAVAPPSDAIPSSALARIAGVRYELYGPAPSGMGPSYVRQSDAELGT